MSSTPVAEGLPVDILHYLISTLLPAYLPPIPLTRTLLSLSLVSHSFRSIAQPALFKTPFLSYDPPDTTPPGRTFTRIEQLISTLEKRKDLRRKVRGLNWLGQWSTRCLSEGIPNRKEVSKIMIKLVRILFEEQGSGTRLKILSFPFVTMSDKDEFLDILSSASTKSTRTSTKIKDKDGREEEEEECCNGGGIEEILFGEGGAYETSNDPWVINIDQRVREEWGVAKFTINDFKRLHFSNEGWRKVKRFRLMARLRVEDPLEEDDRLAPSDPFTQGISGEEEKFEFRLEEFELNLLRNSKLSFNYLDRLLRSSLPTLTTLILREHQFENLSTLYRFLEAYGRNLRVLKTTSSNQFADNSPLLQVVSRACTNLRSLTIGSSCRRELLNALETLSSNKVGEGNDGLEYLELSNCYSLALFPAVLSTEAKGDGVSEDEEEGRLKASHVVDELSRVLFRFKSLRKLIIGPQHASIEDGYEQERNVGRLFRDLDGIREGEGSGRVISSQVSFWRWKVELWQD
ncbi:hypothetical protein JCM5350_006204 [Sporobolomyces pararoseus]